MSELRDFRPIEILELPEGRIRQTVPEEGFDHLLTLQYIPTGHLILQTAFVTREGRAVGREYDTVHTYLLDAFTGEGVFVGTQLNRIVAASDTVIVTERTSPFPRIEVYRVVGR
jgi:hypothetical protein